MAIPKPIDWLASGSDLSLSWAAFEFWINRYQSLIGTLVAAAGIFFLFQQTKTMRKQVDMLQAETSRQRAGALAMILDIIGPMAEVAGEISAYSYIAGNLDSGSRIWRVMSGDPVAKLNPEQFRSYNRDELLKAVVDAAPDHLAKIRSLLDSADEYKAAWASYTASGSTADGGSPDPVAEYHSDADYRRLVDAISRLRDNFLDIRILDPE